MSDDGPLPSRDEIIAFIKESTTPVSRREIARAFSIKGDDRRELRSLLKTLEDEGAIERGDRRKLAPPAALPAVQIIEVESIDPDGDVVCRPSHWDSDEPPPTILLVPGKRRDPAPGVGDRILARLDRQNPTLYHAKPIRRLDQKGPGRILGVVERSGKGYALRPTDRRIKSDFILTETLGSAPGDIVMAETLETRARMGPKKARVVEKVGTSDAAGAASLIAIHARSIPSRFSDPTIVEAEACREPTLGDRVDLREVPLVTIDGADARDFDDAVYAEPLDAQDSTAGWRLIVAIADVSAYVLTGSSLDREAYDRGNSCYFPDRVVPMLPEALSNGLCSLRPKEDRACLFAELWLDNRGVLKRHRFRRGLMRSAARLTYEQVQQAMDGTPDDTTGPLVDDVLRPLYGAYKALAAARDHRGTLELDVPERQVTLSDDGFVTGITVRSRLDSHRLIEEFMITANVAAAEALEAKRTPCIYRVHPEPDRAKFEVVRDFLKGLGYPVAKGQVLTPRLFTEILKRASGRPEAPLVSDVVLRSQSQAYYSPENVGHFGLALSRYAHFTSPIRRYADLMVHRALVRAYGLGLGGLQDDDLSRFGDIADHISYTERRAVDAERDAMDRYVAGYLSTRVGKRFSGRISGLSGFGLFVRLEESGAEGLVPISTLPDDFYVHMEERHALIGRRWGRTYRLAATVEVELVEANSVTGSTVFRLVNDDGADLSVPALATSGERQNAQRRTGPRKNTGPARGKRRTDKRSRSR